MVLDQMTSPGKMSQYVWSPLPPNSRTIMMVMVKLEGVSERGFEVCPAVPLAGRLGKGSRRRVEGLGHLSAGGFGLQQ